MNAELSLCSAGAVAEPDLVPVPTVAEVDGLVSASEWRLLVRGPRRASREAAVRTVTAVGPADQRRLVVLAALDAGLLRALEATPTFALVAGTGAAVEVQLESLTRAGALALIVGLPVGAGEDPSHRTEPVTVPTPEGAVEMSAVQGEEGEVALVVELGRAAAAVEPIVYLHRGCLFGDALGSRDCPRGRRLGAALERIGASGGGIVVYLRDEGSLGDCCAPLAAPPRPVSATLRARLGVALGRLRLGPVELLATAADRRRVGGLGLRVARSTEPR